MLCAALLLVLLASDTQGQDASSSSLSSSSSSSSSSLRQSGVELQPRSLAVLSGHQARFNCSTIAPWETMLWRLDDNTVMIIFSTLGSTVNQNGQYTAVNCSTPQMSCWELVLEKVVRGNATQPRRVTCELFNGSQMTADLDIQESGSVVIIGDNTCVSSGDQVRFQCLAHGWFPEPSLEWFLSGVQLDNGTFNTSSELDQGRGLYNTTSTLGLEAWYSGNVECRVSVPAMAGPLSANTSLTIVPVRDDTAVIAVVSYVGAMLVVVLITICIILYLRRRSSRKESTHQETVRIDQHQSEQNSVAEETEGRVNAGYTSEGSSSFIDTDPSTSMHSRRTTACTEEMPDVISSLAPAYGNTVHFISLRDTTVKTRRQVTTV